MKLLFCVARNGPVHQNLHWCDLLSNNRDSCIVPIADCDGVIKLIHHDLDFDLAWIILPPVCHGHVDFELWSVHLDVLFELYELDASTASCM